MKSAACKIPMQSGRAETVDTNTYKRSRRATLRPAKVVSTTRHLTAALDGHISHRIFVPAGRASLNEIKLKRENSHEHFTLNHGCAADWWRALDRNNRVRASR